jgi:hypothetical protein
MEKSVDGPDPDECSEISDLHDFSLSHFLELGIESQERERDFMIGSSITGDYFTYGADDDPGHGYHIPEFLVYDSNVFRFDLLMPHTFQRVAERLRWDPNGVN